jgi:hypothetical protein
MDCYDNLNIRKLGLIQQSKHVKDKGYYNSPRVGKCGCYDSPNRCVGVVKATINVCIYRLYDKYE